MPKGSGLEPPGSQLSQGFTTILQDAPLFACLPVGRAGDECSDFKNPIGNGIFAETGLRRELSRTKVSVI